MASASAIALPPLFHCGTTKSQLGGSWKPQVPAAAYHPLNSSLLASVGTSPGSHIGRKHCASIARKAAGESTDSSSESVVEYLKDAWGNSEDRIALIGLGFAGIVAVWASSNLITAVDTLPLLPGILEFIGILFSWWFIYRYLLFKPDRAELVENVKKSLSDVLGK